MSLDLLVKKPKKKKYANLASSRVNAKKVINTYGSYQEITRSNQHRGRSPVKVTASPGQGSEQITPVKTRMMLP